MGYNIEEFQTDDISFSLQCPVLRHTSAYLEILGLCTFNYWYPLLISLILAPAVIIFKFSECGCCCCPVTK